MNLKSILTSSLISYDEFVNIRKVAQQKALITFSKKPRPCFVKEKNISDSLIHFRKSMYCFLRNPDFQIKREIEILKHDIDTISHYSALLKLLKKENHESNRKF